MYKTGELVAQLFVVKAPLWFTRWLYMKKSLWFPRDIAFTVVETRGIEPLTS